MTTKHIVARSSVVQLPFVEPLTTLEIPCPDCQQPLWVLPTKGYALCLEMDCANRRAYIVSGHTLLEVCRRCLRIVSNCSCEDKCNGD